MDGNYAGLKMGELHVDLFYCIYEAVYCLNRLSKKLKIVKKATQDESRIMQSRVCVDNC